MSSKNENEWANPLDFKNLHLRLFYEGHSKQRSVEEVVESYLSQQMIVEALCYAKFHNDRLAFINALTDIKSKFLAAKDRQQ
jgi:hypothetical protein